MPVFAAGRSRATSSRSWRRGSALVFSISGVDDGYSLARARLSPAGDDRAVPPAAPADRRGPRLRDGGFASELGLRWRAERASLDLALFHMDKDGVILRDSAGFNVSGGKTRHEGLEYEGDWSFADDWSLSAAGTVARHEYRFTAAVEQGEQITSGNDMDTAPRNIHSLRLHHDAAWLRRRTRMALDRRLLGERGQHRALWRPRPRQPAALGRAREGLDAGSFASRTCSMRPTRTARTSLSATTVIFRVAVAHTSSNSAGGRTDPCNTVPWRSRRFVGATLALQVGMAGTMRSHVGSPMAAALVNFAVGTMFLVVAVALGRGSLAGLAQAGAAPWWAWGAGILGGLYITASAAFGPIARRCDISRPDRRRPDGRGARARPLRAARFSRAPARCLARRRRPARHRRNVPARPAELKGTHFTVKR